MVQFLQTSTFISAISWFLAIATPLIAILSLKVYAKKRTQMRNHPLFWVLAASGPALFILWLIFNAIENALGLDSILAMLLNLLLFCVVGCGVGAWVRFGMPTHRDSSINGKNTRPIPMQKSK